jgi:hypothetical protein
MHKRNNIRSIISVKMMLNILDCDTMRSNVIGRIVGRLEPINSKHKVVNFRTNECDRDESLKLAIRGIIPGTWSALLIWSKSVFLSRFDIMVQSRNCANDVDTEMKELMHVLLVVSLRS